MVMVRERSGILGLFQEAMPAADALDLLRKEGFTDDDFELITGTPYPEGAFGERKTKHRLFAFPLIGAAAGFSMGVLITAATQLSWPLVTGGKPILSIPPMVIITYEGTMLGAILFTIIGIIFESRLPRPLLGLYDPRITEGWIGVEVQGTLDRLGRAEAALKQAGAVEIKR